MKKNDKKDKDMLDTITMLRYESTAEENNSAINAISCILSNIPSYRTLFTSFPATLGDSSSAECLSRMILEAEDNTKAKYSTLDLRKALLKEMKDELSPSHIYAHLLKESFANKSTKLKIKPDQFLTVNASSNTARSFDNLWEKRATLGSSIRILQNTAVFVLELQRKNSTLMDVLSTFTAISGILATEYRLVGMITYGNGGYRAVLTHKSQWIGLWDESILHIQSWGHLVKWMIKDYHSPVMLFYSTLDAKCEAEFKLERGTLKQLYEFVKEKEPVGLLMEKEVKKEVLHKKSISEEKTRICKMCFAKDSFNFRNKCTVCLFSNEVEQTEEENKTKEPSGPIYKEDEWVCEYCDELNTMPAYSCKIIIECAKINENIYLICKMKQSLEKEKIASVKNKPCWICHECAHKNTLMKGECSKCHKKVKYYCSKCRVSCMTLSCPVCKTNKVLKFTQDL